VHNVLAGIVIGACLLGAGWTVVLAIRDRRATNGLLIELAVVELLLVVQLVVAVIQIASGDRPDSTLTFLAYAVGVLLILPIGVFWSQAERSRSSTLVIAVAAVAAAVMTARMLQLWGSA
jgi:flagellar biosynthesis protein FliQ